MQPTHISIAILTCWYGSYPWYFQYFIHSCKFNSLVEIKDCASFSVKHPMNGELLKQCNKIEAMNNWSYGVEISIRTTIFINGYKLPNAYGIEDLQYFLLE